MTIINGASNDKFSTRGGGQPCQVYFVKLWVCKITAVKKLMMKSVSAGW
jgi:hypothetical protein